MQTEHQIEAQKKRPRPPIWFLKRQFQEVDSLIEEVKNSESLAVKAQKVAAARTPLQNVLKKLTVLTICSYVALSAATFYFDNLTFHSPNRGYFQFFRLIVLIVFGGLVTNEWEKARALRKQLSATADLAFLPAIVSQFPPKYTDEYDIGDRTKEANVYTLLELLARPQASSVLSVSDRHKLLRYCDSADKLPSFMVNNRMWAAKIRRAVQELDSENER